MLLKRSQKSLVSLWKSSFNNQMQTFIPHSSCLSNVRERQSLLHNTFKEPRSQWFQNCIWLHARLRFEIWKGEFVLEVWFRFSCPLVKVLCLLCAFVLFLATLHLKQTFFIHFYIFLCEFLLIHTPCLLHNCSYLILFFSFVSFMNLPF